MLVFREMFLQQVIHSQYLYFRFSRNLSYKRHHGIYLFSLWCFVLLINRLPLCVTPPFGIAIPKWQLLCTFKCILIVIIIISHYRSVSASLISIFTSRIAFKLTLEFLLPVSAMNISSFFMSYIYNIGIRKYTTGYLIFLSNLHFNILTLSNRYIWLIWGQSTDWWNGCEQLKYLCVCPRYKLSIQYKIILMDTMDNFVGFLRIVQWRFVMECRKYTKVLCCLCILT